MGKGTERWKDIDNKDCWDIETVIGVLEDKVEVRVSNDCWESRTVSAEVMQPLQARQSDRETLAVFADDLWIMLLWTEQFSDGFRKSFRSVIFIMPEKSIYSFGFGLCWF